jgi:SAM-dependent methyltransferase
MVERWAPVGGKRVLDVGCGVGTYTSAFHQLGAEALGMELELERAQEARSRGALVVQAAGEALPFKSGSFDLVFSHEVIEHASNDRKMAAEMVRVAKGGGRILVFCPNRWYPFETHGHYWRGRYHFGNTPLINYLPNRLRNQLAPHVRTYSGRGLRALFAGLPTRLVHHTQIFPGYDNLVARHPAWGGRIRRISYQLERTPLRVLGLSHVLVLEKTEPSPT